MRCLCQWHGTHKIKHTQQAQSNAEPNLNGIDNEEKGETSGVEAQNLYTYRKPNQIKCEKNVERVRERKKKRTGLRKNRTEQREDKIGKI